jgi:hypothetical protein
LEGIKNEKVMRGMAMNADRMMTSFKPVTNEWLGASSSSDGIKKGKKHFMSLQLN